MTRAWRLETGVTVSNFVLQLRDCVLRKHSAGYWWWSKISARGLLFFHTALQWPDSMESDGCIFFIGIVVVSSYNLVGMSILKLRVVIVNYVSGTPWTFSRRRSRKHR
jgi:hypothetical protein